MAEPSITDLFGSGATQDATTITIQKADLASSGFTPSASNSAESILAAVLTKGKGYLTQANADANPDQSVTVVDGITSIISRNDGSGTFVPYRQFQMNVNFTTPDTATFSPDDY